MQYMLMIYGDETARQSVTKEQMEQMFAAYGAYTKALRESGAFVAGDPLQPSSMATTVRVANGNTKVLNGPYADTKEQLGGYYVIEAKDMDAALSWAARCPGASHGVMEVRPVRPM